MDDDFFTQEGDVVVNNQTQETQGYMGTPNSYNNMDDDFDFGGTVVQAEVQIYSQSSYTSPEEDQTQRRMKEEEEKIQEKLRQKANEEYQLKQKRREQGRKQLQQFFEKKEQEKQERKRENIEKQTRSREEAKKLEKEAGWNRVAANIPLKQGEHVGKNPINRMREAIINKKNDQQ